MQNNHDEKLNQWPCVQKSLLFYKIQLICDACDKIDFDFLSTECREQNLSLVDDWCDGMRVCWVPKILLLMERFISQAAGCWPNRLSAIDCFCIFFFLGATKMPPVNQMRQSNLIFNTCKIHTKNAFALKWISMTNTHTHRTTQHSTAQMLDDKRRNRRKHKYWKSFSHPIILIVALRLAFLMKFIEWRRQINVWFFRYRISVKIFFFLDFVCSIPFACPHSNFLSHSFGWQKLFPISNEIMIRPVKMIPIPGDFVVDFLFLKFIPFKILRFTLGSWTKKKFLLIHWPKYS